MRVLKQNGSRAAVLVGATNVQLQKKQSNRYKLKKPVLLLVFIGCKPPLSFWFGRSSALNTCFEPCWQMVTDAWSLFAMHI